MSEKTYTIAGTTIFNNKRTFRFANGKLNLRRNMLKHFGHRAIKLIELPKPMDKVHAMAFLQKQGMTAALPTRSKSNKKSQLVIAAEKLVEKGRKISESKGKDTPTVAPVIELVQPVTEPAAEPIAA